MRTIIISLAVGLVSVVSANPLLTGRAISPDNTCGLTGAGGNKGYTCNAAAAQGGRCCSPNGWCGNSDAYCGTGCQKVYGQCGAASTTTKQTTTSKTSTAATGPTGSVTNCGPSYGNAKCAQDLCCSKYNWCGVTADHCGTGCQSAFGSCGVKPSSTSPTKTSTAAFPTGTSHMNCGPAYGNQVCATGLCCSASGWCNNDEAHCGAGCQSKFGACGTQTAHPAGPTSTTVCGPEHGYAVCGNNLCCSANGQCGTGPGYCTDPETCQFGYGRCDSSVTPSGQSTINDPRPLLGSVSYTQDISSCTVPNVVALTYDDGPYEYTSHLLDVLKTYGFTATFFSCANNIAKGQVDITSPYPDLYRRMIAEGHQVASHTFSHYNLAGISSADRIQQMVKNERSIANILGKYPTYMRPPYSSCDGPCQADMQKLGYHRVYFDIDSTDYENDTADLIQNAKNTLQWNLGNHTNGQNVLSLQHDIHYQTSYNVSRSYFDGIRDRGWKGVTVGECLGDPKKNWYRVPGTGAGTA